MCRRLLGVEMEKMFFIAVIVYVGVLIREKRVSSEYWRMREGCFGGRKGRGDSE